MRINTCTHTHWEWRPDGRICDQLPSHTDQVLRCSCVCVCLCVCVCVLHNENGTKNPFTGLESHSQIRGCLWRFVYNLYTKAWITVSLCCAGWNYSLYCLRFLAVFGNWAGDKRTRPDTSGSVRTEHQTWSHTDGLLLFLSCHRMSSWSSRGNVTS